MKSIEDQFKKCKFIFMQNKIIAVILSGMVFTAVVVGFTFGSQLNDIKCEVYEFKQDRIILQDIKIAIDSLLKGVIDVY